MATVRKQELNALLNPIQKTVSGFSSGVSSGLRNTGVSMPSFSLGSGGEGGGGWGSFFFSAGIMLLFLFTFLLIIHYTITPVFSFTKGDGGSIPLANTSDGQLVWTKAPPLADVSANVQRILPYGFTIQQDVYMDNESALSNRKRLFFYRSNVKIVADNAQPDNLLVQYPDSNLFMYLSPNTNDMIVTAVTENPRNRDRIFESVPTLLNVPIKEVVRITVVLLPEMMEVYLNGKLYGTRTFRYPLVPTVTYFFSTPDAYRNSVRVMNLQYWDRPLSSAEIKNASPPLTAKALYNPEEMATGQCA